MDLNQLSYFVAVAEQGQFTRAAARVSVAQPAVSAQIRRLERELGEPLFHRDRRGVRLTEAGETLLPHARAALAAAERGRASIASLRGMLHGRLVVGVAGPVDRRFAAALGEFHRAHPAVEIVFAQQQNEPLLEAVAGGDVDAALVGLGAQPVPPGVRSRVVATEPLVVALRTDHPFSSRRTVGLAQLRLALCAAADFAPHSRTPAVMSALCLGSPPRPETSPRSSNSSPKGWAWQSFPARRQNELMSPWSASPAQASSDAPLSPGTRPPPRPLDAPSSRLLASNSRETESAGSVTNRAGP